VDRRCKSQQVELNERATNRRKQRKSAIKLTRYCLDLLNHIATGQKHHILLRGIYIVIFQEKDLVDATFLESGEFDKESQRPGECLFYDEIFLSTDLCMGKKR